MEFIKDRKKIKVKDIFITCDDFKNYLKTNNDKINYEDDTIIKKIDEIYKKMIYEDGVILWNRFSRWLHNKFEFKKSNVLITEFWLERGWCSEYSKEKISNINRKRSLLGEEKKKIKRKTILFDGETKIVFKGVEYFSDSHPLCGVCSNKLSLIKKYEKNQKVLKYFKIIKCSNENCETKNYNNKKLYESFVPIDIANKKNEDLYEIKKNTNRLCLNSWVNKGFSPNEAKIKISEIQKHNSKLVKNKFIRTKENLRLKGYSEEQIKKICLTPPQIQFWVKKGFTEEESKLKVRENQLNAIKYVNYKNILIPSKVNFWIKKGFTEEESKLKVSERQRTFSLKICIEKYGEEEGLKRFNERQIKWLKNFKRNNFSKISQELFWGILNEEPSIREREIYFATYNKGEKDISGKNNEYRLKLFNRVILPDFLDLVNKKIIEFDGTYYHRKTPENILREGIRDKNILESGFDVLHINEKDFKDKKEEMIKKCIDFLK